MKESFDKIIKDCLKRIDENILDFKRKMEEARIDTTNVLYCHEVPMLGIDKSYVIEEIAGIKVAKLIGYEEDN